jgi:hypothetical protein
LPYGCRPELRQLHPLVRRPDVPPQVKPDHFGSSGSSSYQSSCRDHLVQRKHCVSVHSNPQPGQTPCVSKVFHACKQTQLHRSFRPGSHPHFGQRMRRRPLPVLAARSGWRMRMRSGSPLSSQTAGSGMTRTLRPKDAADVTPAPPKPAMLLLPCSPRSVGPSNTADKLRSGARVHARRRGHEAALPSSPRCRRELRQLHPLVRRSRPPLARPPLHACLTAGSTTAASGWYRLSA